MGRGRKRGTPDGAFPYIYWYTTPFLFVMYDISHVPGGVDQHLPLYIRDT